MAEGAAEGAVANKRSSQLVLKLKKKTKIQEEDAEKTATNLADALKTAVEAAPAPAPAPSAGLLGFLTNPTSVTKKVVGYICDSYNFWMNPSKARRAGPLLHDKGLDIQLLDLVSLGLAQQISNIDITDMVIQIVTEIRNSDHFLVFVPINSDRIMLFAADAATVAASASAGRGGRSRRRSAKKKTRRPRRKYYSIKNIKGRGSRISKRKMITRCRSRKRKN
jgi:hypothetical protein